MVHMYIPYIFWGDCSYIGFFVLYNCYCYTIEGVQTSTFMCFWTYMYMYIFLPNMQVNVFTYGDRTLPSINHISLYVIRFLLRSSYLYLGASQDMGIYETPIETVHKICQIC